MWYAWAVLGFSSVFSLTTLIFPAKSLDRSSTTGATALQGPHHGAQKSTSTGMSALRTTCSKVASVTFATVDIFGNDLQNLLPLGNYIHISTVSHTNAVLS